MTGVNVKSEIGPLKKVILHRPGKELLNLTPDTLERLLFDDIPFLRVAQDEHDAFAQVLREEGVEGYPPGLNWITFGEDTEGVFQ